MKTQYRLLQQELEFYRSANDALKRILREQDALLAKYRFTVAKMDAMHHQVLNKFGIMDNTLSKKVLEEIA